jgi:hypothetical protein
LGFSNKLKMLSKGILLHLQHRERISQHPAPGWEEEQASER